MSPEPRTPDTLLGLSPSTIEADTPLDELGYDGKAMFTSIASDVARARRSPLAWLRDLATQARLALAAVVVIGFASYVGWTTGRSDLATLPRPTLALALGSSVVALSAMLSLALRPSHRPELGRARFVAALVASLLVAVALAFVPMPDAPTRQVLGPIAPPNWASGLPCMTLGILVAVPSFFLVRLVDRGARRNAFAAAAVAGLAANLTLLLHCGLGEVGHRLSTHASQGALLLVCLGIAAGVEQFVAPRARSTRGS